MLALLRERGYVAADTKSVSSTVSKIYIEEIEKEFAAKAAPVPAAVTAEPPVPPQAEEPAKARVPVGIFVKTAQDVARERESVAKLAPPARPQTPLSKAPSPPPPRPVSPQRPPSMAPFAAPPSFSRPPQAPLPPRAPSLAPFATCLLYTSSCV